MHGLEAPGTGTAALRVPGDRRARPGLHGYQRNAKPGMRSLFGLEMQRLQQLELALAVEPQMELALALALELALAGAMES